MAIFPTSMPYDDLKIIDQSQYSDTPDVEAAPQIPTGPVALCPFISPRGYGEDGKLMYMTSSRLDKYGTPNLKKYGLSLYLAKQFAAGKGTVLGIRVTSSKATYANQCVFVKLAKEDLPSYVSESTGSYINPVIKNYPMWSIAGEQKYFTAIEIGDTMNINTIGKTSTDGDEYSVPKITSTSEDAIVIDAETFATLRVYDIAISGSSTSKVVLAYVEGSNPTLYTYQGSTEQDAENNPTSYTLTAVAEAVSESTIVLSYHGVSAENATDPVAWINSDGATASFGEGENVLPIDKFNAESEDPFVVDGKKAAFYCPMFVVKALAKGEFANAFKYRLTADTTMNERVSEESFFYKFIDSESGATLDENMSFTFNDDYVYLDECMSADDVFSTYSENIELVKADKFETFMGILKSLCCSDAVTSSEGFIGKEDPYQLDILFGQNTYANKLRVIVPNSNNGTINLSSIDGIQLTGGDDGWDGKEYSFREINAVENELFAKELADVYNGTVTDLIYDEIRYPYTYIFAPSYDPLIVNAIHELVVDGRRLTRANYFLPKFSTYLESRNWKNSNMSNINSWKETIVPEWGLIKDPYTSKKTYMPSVYFDSYYMPDHWVRMLAKPYAGQSNYSWTGFVTGSLTPASTNPNEYIANHNVQINTVCETGTGYATPYEQITAQPSPTSRLSEINNAITLTEMVRIALKIANDKRWSDLGDEEVSSYKKTVEEAIAIALSSCYSRLEVFAERESVNGAGRARIHCKLNVLFKDMLKGVSYEFYILAN